MQKTSAKYEQTEYNNTLKRSYATNKWDLSRNASGIQKWFYSTLDMTEQFLHSWIFIRRKQNINYKRYMHTNVHCSIIYSSEDTETN